MNRGDWANLIFMLVLIVGGIYTIINLNSHPKIDDNYWEEFCQRQDLVEQYEAKTMCENYRSNRNERVYTNAVR